MSAYLAAGQSMHAPAPAPLEVPLGHEVHSLAPAMLLEYPLGHNVQDELPSTLKVPTSHVMHAWLAVPECVPAGHTSVEEAPVRDTYLPLSASLH